MSRKVWWNGQIIEEKDAKISIYSEYAMFGLSVFEMTRSFNKIHFKLEEHIDRLLAGCKMLKFDLPYTKEQLVSYCDEITDINDKEFREDDEHRLLISVSRGGLSIYKDADNYTDGFDVFIADFPLRWTTRGSSKYYKYGINAVIPSQRTVPASIVDPKIKNRNRLHFIMANMEVANMKGDRNWALLLDQDGFITEGTGSNFMIVKNNILISPEPRNILRGISRQYIIDMWTNSFKKEFIERNIEPYDVYTADAAFFCCTPFSILPCVSLNGIPINNGIVRTKEYDWILEEWEYRVGVTIDKQIEKWDLEFGENIDGTTPYEFKK